MKKCKDKREDEKMIIEAVLDKMGSGKWEFLRIKKLLPMIATHYYQSLLTLSMHDHHYLEVLFGKL